MKQKTAAVYSVRSCTFAVVSLLLLAGLSACGYRGQIDQPLTQKVTWFSYLNGDDIRARCQPGGGFEYRMVYNGRYDEQIRSYEVTGTGDGSARFVARVQEGSGIDLTRLSAINPFKNSAWTKAERRLEPQELSRLEAALEASGAGRATSKGLRLFSGEFYWLSSICYDGVFVFNAWRYPSDRFAALAFPDVLLSLDTTGVPLNPPRAIAAAERIKANSSHPDQRDYNPTFNIEVGDNGLMGAAGKI